MFQVSQHPSSGALKTVTAASGTGHNIGTATSLQRGLSGTGLCDLHLVGFLLTLKYHKYRFLTSSDTITEPVQSSSFPDEGLP